MKRRGRQRAYEFLGILQSQRNLQIPKPHYWNRQGKTSLSFHSDGFSQLRILLKYLTTAITYNKKWLFFLPHSQIHPSHLACPIVTICNKHSSGILNLLSQMAGDCGAVVAAPLSPEPSQFEPPVENGTLYNSFDDKLELTCLQVRDLRPSACFKQSSDDGVTDSLAKAWLPLVKRCHSKPQPNVSSFLRDWQ